MIRQVFQSLLTASLSLAYCNLLFGAGYSTADDNLVLSRSAPPIAGFTGGYTAANDPLLRTSGRALAGRPGLARVASGESSPTDLPAPLDPDQVFPPEGRPNQRPSMVSEIGAGSAVASDQQSRGGRRTPNRPTMD